jgi:putative molybdopterin biosynthesis protein
MSRQEQFLDVIDRDEAARRFQAAVRLAPVGVEEVALGEALGRVLATDLLSPIDVPSFDRSNVDGFALLAADTLGATEETPRQLRLLAEVVSTGYVPTGEIRPGEAMSLATGGMLPRGADAVVMVEHTDQGNETNSSQLLIRRALASGANITFAATDITRGETVLHAGKLLTSRETGVLAAIGCDRVAVFSKPRVAILSTGDELISPGQPMQPGLVYDSNARILADSVRELGGEPVMLGIAPDIADQLQQRLDEAIATCDMVLLSGGTSKGAGDISYRIVSRLSDPGIVAHGVALKPGKPICLAATQGKAVVILPGFPTSAIFTFHEFVAPVLRRLAGRTDQQRTIVEARMGAKVNSEIGRTEYLLVSLVRSDQTDSSPLTAYPLGKGSGSVTTFSHADGFITIGRHEEIVPANATVNVQLLGRDLQLADLVAIGSHCIGLDYLLGQLEREGIRTKSLSIGSLAGLEAAKRGECDLAGIHLLEPASGEYNRPWLTPTLRLVAGYDRMQGIVLRSDDRRLSQKSLTDLSAAIREDKSFRMVNRNAGSGTRVLIDRLLGDVRPLGYAVQPRSHHAVAAAVAQGRADWGVCIETVARNAGLDFLPLQVERYDFVIPVTRWDRPAVQAFIRLLDDPRVRARLNELGYRAHESS